MRLASKLINKYDLHSSLAQPRTFEATAVTEVHFLHALGEHEFVDGTCGREARRGTSIK